MQQPTCGDCATLMEAGFIPDHYSVIMQSHWHPGVAKEKSLIGNLKLNREAMIPVITFRCPQCGLLKQYAENPEV